MREYVAAHPKQRERAKQRSKDWRKAHPETYQNRREYILQWHKDHPQSPERKKHFGIRKLYGITFDDYKRMLAAQDEKCALCGTTDSGRKRKATKWGIVGLAIDHCHKTGRVRGLLCHPCNARLGSYEIIVDTIGETRVKEYLTHDDPSSTAGVPQAVCVPGGAGAQRSPGVWGDRRDDDQAESG